MGAQSKKEADLGFLAGSTTRFMAASMAASTAGPTVWVTVITASGRVSLGIKTWPV